MKTRRLCPMRSDNGPHCQIYIIPYSYMIRANHMKSPISLNRSTISFRNYLCAKTCLTSWVNNEKRNWYGKTFAWTSLMAKRDCKITDNLQAIWWKSSSDWTPFILLSGGISSKVQNPLWMLLCFAFVLHMLQCNCLCVANLRCESESQEL